MTEYVAIAKEALDEQLDPLLKQTLPCRPETIKQIIVAKNKTQIGYGVTWENRYHPYCDEIFIYVVPDFRREHIGSEIIDRLKKEVTQPLMRSVDADNKAAVGFLRAHGFALKRRCWEYDVTPEQIPDLSDADKLPLVSWADLSPDELVTVKNALLEHYRSTHESVSPMNADMTKEEWFNVMLDHLDMTYSYVYSHDDLTTFVTTYDTTDKKKLEIGYVNFKEDEEAFGVFVTTIMGHLKNRFESFGLEIDGTDAAAMVLLELYPPVDVVTFDAYVAAKSSQ